VAYFKVVSKHSIRERERERTTTLRQTRARIANLWAEDSTQIRGRNASYLTKTFTEKYEGVSKSIRTGRLER
jgi:hypothetical protein